MQGNEVYVGRSSARHGLPGAAGGNPYKIRRDGGRKGVLELFQDLAHENYSENNLRELRGRVLGCHCRPDQDCVADVLEKLAESISKVEESGTYGHRNLEDDLPVRYVEATDEGGSPRATGFD